MTDVSLVKAHADTQPASVAFYDGPPAPAYLHRSPTLDGTIDEEESSTIKCICHYSDDDGNTVLCEKCDTWQHIICYYESAQHVPDVHECTDCLPRPVDARGASEKQRHRREQMHNLGERKGRPKSTAKNPKKRTKDPLGSVPPNGWVANSNDLHYNSERKSGSPRDQLPPSKRPKTSHRASGSMSVISQPPAFVPTSRKRGNSVAVNGHNPVKSPITLDGPIEDFSSEFMHLCQQSDPPSTSTNSYTSIGVANDIAMWLTDPVALAEVSGGKKPQDLFSRIEKTIEDIEVSTAPVIVKRTDEDHSITAHGLHPKWHYVTVDNCVPENGYVGELKGLVGRKEDYYSDPSNRWDLLRHPEPFVFFPPHLPIYIDTRQEGNILRFARRSCVPNMVMKILIEPSSDYHFCFLAIRPIDPGEELTVGWDIDSEVQKQLAKVVTNGAKEGFKRIQPWVSCVLANFGGCACESSAGHECLFERARRTTVAEPFLQPKTKGRKSKKLQVSPLSTGHATNSRAGSEALHRDVADDENMDSRSTSGSHKSSSRDHTPATHLSSLEAELKMSNREKRKLQQQESLFEKLENDEQHKSKKGKRNSAGSTLNTPSLSSSKRLGFPEPSPTPRHREHSHGVARKTSGSSTKTTGRSLLKPKSIYVDASTQTNHNDANVRAHNHVTKLRDMMPPISFKHKLLQQAREEKIQRERIRSLSIQEERESPSVKEISNKPSPLPPSPPMEESSAMELSTEPINDTRSRESIPAKEPTPAPEADVDMKDAESIIVPEPSEPEVEEMADAPAEEASSCTSHPPMNPPAPPWPTSPSTQRSSTSAQQSPTSTTESPKKHVELHVPMPQKFDPADPSATTYSMAAPGSVTAVITASAMAQSPGNIVPPSPFSPAVNNAVNPTPARKKLSLSDYTSRRAKLAQAASSGSMPSLSHSQSTTSPTLSATSLPDISGSPTAKGTEPPLSTVTEEPKSIQTTAATSTPTLI